jgi:hypothetical protein
MEGTADYDFFATIHTPSAVVKRVRCRLWLPKKVSAEPRFEFYPTQAQAEHFLGSRLNPYAVTGKVELSRTQITTITADEVWTDSVPRRNLDRVRSETIFMGVPWDLRVYEHHHRTRRAKSSVRAVTHYLLTPSDELTPIISTWRRRKVLQRIVIRVAAGRRLQFVETERREQHDDAICLVRELAAKENHFIPSDRLGVVDEEQLHRIDDLLALVSFASRHRVACLSLSSRGYDGSWLRFYRRHISRPPTRKQERHEAVIDLADFEDFLPVAHVGFIATGRHELIRHALYVSVPSRNQTVESRFATVFAAVESLVLWFRRQNDLEYAVGETEWTQLKGDLVAFIRQHELLSGDPVKKRRGGAVRANLNALRRISFNTAFGRFCSTFGVPTEDLWPMTTQRGDVGLVDIRNRVVHGSVFDHRQFSALATAAEHLDWLLERMLLRVLGWPLDRSNVSGERLRQIRLAFVDLPNARKAMQTVPAPPAYVE